MANISNNAPSVAWRGGLLACGTRRQRLFVNGAETPYFIDSANGVRAHKSAGSEHGLWGSGLGEEIRPGLRIAAMFGAGPDIRSLKHRAEQLALSEQVPA